MKIPERLIGFVDYEGTKYPFEFDADSFYLNLYPPTVDVWHGTSSIRGLIPLAGKQEKKHERIGELRLESFASDGKKVLFCLQANRSNYHGFYSYPVNWYFYCSAQMKTDNISGFSLSGDVINYYFNPQQALESVLHFSSDNTKLEKITVASTKQTTESCGKYRIIPHIDAQVEVTCYASAHTNSFTNPIDATSKMVTIFSSPVDIDTLIDAYRYTTAFFKYVTYRNNIGIDIAPVFCMNPENLRDYAGLLVFEKEEKDEKHKKKAETIIPHEILRHRAGLLFTNIKNDKLGFQHICNSISDTMKYPSSRIIMIFAAFEREYRNIYGTDNARSEEYLSTKEEVVKLIEDYSKTLHGKKRSYSKQLSKFVQNRDSSFEFNLKKVLTDCEEIMMPFVRIKYDGTYTDIIDGICERMGIVRNGIAHSRLDLHFDAIHLCDIKIVEELLYAMRLKKCHLSATEILQSIKRIFRESITI